jgi:hypothetical protein
MRRTFVKALGPATAFLAPKDRDQSDLQLARNVHPARATEKARKSDDFVAA